MRIGRSTVVYLASQVGLSVAGFVATLLIARLLGADVLGTYMVVLSVVFWLNVPATAVGAGVTKRISERRDRGSYAAAGVVLNSLVGIALAAAAVLASGTLDAFVGTSVGGLVAALILGNTALTTVTAVLDGQKTVGTRGVVQALERVARTAFQVALILASWGLGGLLVGHVGALAAATVVGVAVVNVRPDPPSLHHVRSVLEYARYAWLGTLKTRAFAWMDTVVLALFVTHDLIGIYEVAWNLAAILALAGTSVRQILFPELSELSARGEEDRIHRYLEEGLVFTAVFLIPGLVGAALVGDRVLRIYRPEFVQGATVLLLLVVAQIVAAFGSQFLNVVNAVDRPDVAFRINGLFVVGNLTLNVVLVDALGWYGAAIATAVSALILCVLGYRALSTIVGPPSLPFAEFGKQLSAAGLMAAVLLPLDRLAPTGNGVAVALVLLGAGVYGATLLAISTHVRGRVVELVTTDD